MVITRVYSFDQMTYRWICFLILLIQFSYSAPYLKALGPIRTHSVISVEWWCIITTMAFTWVLATLLCSGFSYYRPFPQLGP